MPPAPLLLPGQSAFKPGPTIGSGSQPFAPMPAAPTPAPAPVQPSQPSTPDGLKAMIVAKYPDGMTSSGVRYADMNPRDLAQQVAAKYPTGVTNDGRSYNDFLAGSFGAIPTSSFGGNPSTTPDNPIKDYASDVLANVKAGGQELGTGLKEAPAQSGANLDTLTEGVGKILGGAATAVAAPFTPVVAPVLHKTITPVVKTAGDALSNTPLLQAFGKDTASLPANQPTAPERVASTIGDFANAAGTVAGFGEAPEVPKALDNVATKTSDALSSVKTSIEPSPASVDEASFAKYQKAVKPTIAGKTTFDQTAQYKNNAITAIKTITANKDNLKFTNPEDGSIETGRLPQTRGEFAQAIDQTKQAIYKQYDGLAKQAGDQGATVKPEDITSPLASVVNNKALQLSHPEAVSYAQSLIDRYGKAGPIDAPTAQGLIENYNNELKSFYRNPSYNQASRVAIDASVVNSLRTSLDKAITDTTGTKYQALRNQYASLKTIENDVNKSANRAARVNDKGLADYTDIFSGGDIAAGIATLNPALFAKGIAQHGIKSYFKFLNNPDRGVQKLFESQSRIHMPPSK